MEESFSEAKVDDDMMSVSVSCQHEGRAVSPGLKILDLAPEGVRPYS